VNELGKRIKQARLAVKFSQRELASRVGVTYPHISKIEIGTETASSELLERIAKEVHVDPDELLFLADRMPEDIQETLAIKKELAPQFLRSWRKGLITDSDVRALLESKEE
jgi:transcriptional regulator with XRE-family HTH domain